MTQPDFIERPILYSAPMVRAILDDRKTQTRRVIKFPENVSVETVNHWSKAPVAGYGLKGEFVPLNINGGISTKAFYEHSIKCPYGQPGDRQWVRENTEKDDDTSDIVTLSRYCADGKPVLYSGSEDAAYDGTVAHWDYSRDVRPSIHMPRWASRIDTLIKDIRIERLQDISEQDALAEGLFKFPHKNDFAYAYDENDKHGHGSARGAFHALWDSINAKTHPWESNPWVWVIDFKRIKP